MRVVSITGERQCDLVDRPMPRVAEDFCLVKVLVTPMCTEFKGFKAGHGSERLGHEAAGEVAEVAQPGKVKVGDRVVVMPQYPCGRCALCLDGEYIHCQHVVKPLEICGSETGTATYAQYLIKEDWLLLPVPEDISLEHASLACCGLGPTFGAMERMDVGALDTLLVMGLGPVGLGGVINGVVRGARVIAVESHPYRVALAKELGAVEVLDPGDPEVLAKLRDLTDGRGVDKAVDATGVAPAQRLMIDALRRHGQACFIGEAGDLTIKVGPDMLRKGISLHGQWHWNLRHTPRMWQVIRQAGPLLDKQITHRFPMSGANDAWELQLTGACGKVLLDPWA